MSHVRWQHTHQLLSCTHTPLSLELELEFLTRQQKVHDNCSSEMQVHLLPRITIRESLTICELLLTRER